MIAWIKTLGIGYLVGVANIIPGVSGGTMALVLGIYARIIAALNNIGLSTAKICLNALCGRKGSIAALKAESKRIDFTFLVLLGFGAVAAIGSMSGLMKFLLREHHAATYAFFMGLVLVSVYVPYRHLKRRGVKEVVCLLIAIFLTVGLSMGVSDDKKKDKAEKKQLRELAEEMQGASADSPQRLFGIISLETPPPRDLAILFLAAAVAISAMILPGISGSFMLLLMGVYFDLLNAVHGMQIAVLAVFALGCMAGLLLFVRLMNWMLGRFYNQTIAFMIGLMIGSLYALWPFREMVEVGPKLVPVWLGPVIPQTFGSSEVVVVGAFILGCAVVAVFCWLDRTSADEKSLV